MLFAQDVAFKPLRYEEDYHKFKSDSSGNPYRKIKYIPVDTNRSYLSLGGEVRYQYFKYKDPGWGTEPEDRDGFVLNRLLVHADVHIGKQLRIFSQIQSSLIAGNVGPNSPIDENPLNMHQLFVDFSLYTKTGKELLFKLGRQELSYGSQRLISVREGPNSRQAFDALRMIFAKKNVRADAFYSTYVKARSNVFGERFWDRSSQLWGTYIAWNCTSQVPNLDVYYLGVKNNAIFVDAQGKEQRHSVGTRLWKKVGKVNYDLEAVYQFGSLSKSGIKAWTISLDAFSQFKILPCALVIGLKTELISGDKAHDDLRINTFNPLYPRGAYFGLASLIGPYNLSDLHPYIQMELSRKVIWSVDYDMFWRMSGNDGIYAVNGSLVHDGRNINVKEIGDQLGTDVSVQLNPFLFCSIEFTRFNAGKFLHRAGMGKDIYMTGITAAIKF
ncbi:alginate export family protein [Dyadobacter sp. CY357]|uniref:Alginate export family protein n=2 Tax=Dyadobacter chenhuakuii TaxID=2909339 RepID=A0A9X1Q7S9_9BACT|nr:alginate export family protein [Dyadobacter chenhuakuii]